MTNFCTWDEVRAAAAELSCEMDGTYSNVWDTMPEMAWVERAWNGLNRRGLTSYENPCDKAYVQLQLLTLSAMFCKFLALAYNKHVSIEYHIWFVDTEIDLVHLETLAGREMTEEFRNEKVFNDLYPPNTGIVPSLDTWETSLYTDMSPDKVTEAIITLIHQQRKHIFEALVAEFNGLELLYVSLFQSQQHENCMEWIEAGMHPDCSTYSNNF